MFAHGVLDDQTGAFHIGFFLSGEGRGCLQQGILVLLVGREVTEGIYPALGAGEVRNAGRLEALASLLHQALSHPAGQHRLAGIAGGRNHGLGTGRGVGHTLGRKQYQ